jgi:HrpA-like RNA helicase
MHCVQECESVKWQLVALGHVAVAGMERLAVQSVSRVQATQRAGRAGRTAPGQCFRLYTQRFFERDMPDTTPPEIQRVPLLGAVLQLKGLPEALCIDVLSFDFVDAPDKESLQDALRHLHLLEAIDESECFFCVSHLQVYRLCSEVCFACDH